MSLSSHVCLSPFFSSLSLSFLTCMSLFISNSTSSHLSLPTLFAVPFSRLFHNFSSQLLSPFSSKLSFLNTLTIFTRSLGFHSVRKSLTCSESQGARVLANALLASRTKNLCRCSLVWQWLWLLLLSSVVLLCGVLCCDVSKNGPSLHCLAVLPTWPYCLNSMCDEYVKSIDSSVCHRPWSILWWIVQVCSLTTDYQGIHFVPSTNILEQLVSILLTILQQISFLLLWSGGHRCMEWILYRVAESSCLLTHNIAPHISLHDLPYQTTKNYEDFHRWNFFTFSQYLYLFHIVFEYSPSFHDQQKMLILPKRLLCWVLSTSDQFLFLSSQFYVIHIHR